MTKIVRNRTNGSREPSKAQAKHNDEVRRFTNRIHELEQYIGTLAKTPKQIVELERDIAALKARSEALMEALKVVASGKFRRPDGEMP